MQLLYLLYIYLVLLVFFSLGKVVFLCWVGDNYSFGDVWDVVCHGFTMDLSMTSYLIVVPILVTMISVWIARLPLRKVLTPYYAVIALLITILWVVDAGLYPFWGFKIDATIFNYIDSPKEALASVSVGFVLIRVLVTLIITVGMTFLLWRLTPKHITLPHHTEEKAKWKSPRILCFIILLLVTAVQPILIRGGLSESTMNPGQAYFSQRQLLNHAAVNPTFSMLYSLGKNEKFDTQYRYLDGNVCQQTKEVLYPKNTNGEILTDTLLNTKRPNILFIVVEGMGDMFYPEGGGPKDVTPNLQQWSQESVWFAQYYNNSFRTDRGLLSVLSGTIGFPSLSVMKLPLHSQLMPSLAQSLKKVGYHTSFWYGGDLNFTNMHGYLTSTGYEKTYSKDDFSRKEQNSGGTWGVTDSIFVDRIWKELKEQKTPFFTTMLTLSSHEPFEVPYQRLEDPIYNAFAYTDHVLGSLLTRLKNSTLWENLLVVIVPDHGFKFGDMEEFEERFFKARMLWTGGAIRTPKKIETLMNQSDVAATLLAQMDISYEDFPWSRNVLSTSYTNPFAYCTFVDGFLYKDTTGISTFDNIGGKTMMEHPTPSQQRVLNGKAILQSSYDWLEELKIERKGE